MKKMISKNISHENLENGVTIQSISLWEELKKIQKITFCWLFIV